MNMAATLKEIESWPLDDQIELVQRVWDGIAESGWQPEITEDLKRELDRRIKALKENPDNVVDWETVLARARQKR